ncbi:MAG: hypothetical protein KKF85_08450 [Gammaproteobacteria bacterium]|nr:hypothetical protein [Rhodocyclaceae bacterium]MBU3910229.1 hypothetical protein [Gammaproteobacteria bacterium]MBU3988815.1 hypothetical protein [Gammaproteobacteria bacterium]MBU4004472.1 hypothetical protein [Gammaproteobacteria bacterium]MBU4022691.1 hypothetical protein [Gammaproteobacteria bacterium]
MTDTTDNRMSFNDAVSYVQQQKKAAFAAMPVFGDNDETAEGARIFILDLDEAGELRLRFIAGPFFSTAHAANEAVSADEIPESVREMRFMPTSYEEDWFTDQIQLLIQKLVQASGVNAEQMPDYKNLPSRGAGPEAVFPISFIGMDENKPH